MTNQGVIIMKKSIIILSFLFAIIAIKPICAQNLNKYKYVIVHRNLPDMNLDAATRNAVNDFYDATRQEIERRFNEMGFTVLSSSKEIGDEKRYVLYCYWAWGIPRTGDIWICLSDSFGQSSILDLYGDRFDSYSEGKRIKKTVDNAFQKLVGYNHHFQPWLIEKDQPNLSISSWSEDSIRSYLISNRVSPIEGIYKSYDKSNAISKIAIIKENGVYYGIALFDDWYTKKGDVIYELNFVETGIYDATVYFSYKTQPIEGYTYINDERNNVLASYESRVLSIAKNSDESDTYLKVFPATDNGYMGSEDNKGMMASGSGIMVADGIIATNYHVVENAKKIEVALNVDGIQTTFVSRVLCVDKTNDLALLSIKDEQYRGVNTPPFKILPNVADVGTSVFAMGFPMSTILGEEMKVTDGIISSKSGYNGDIVTYQISAPIQPGNSGGALFDKKGNLVGITNAGVPGAENVGYAIKSSYLLNLIDSAPINIRVQTGRDTAEQELSNLVKRLTPYVAYIKVY